MGRLSTTECTYPPTYFIFIHRICDQILGCSFQTFLYIFFPVIEVV